MKRELLAAQILPLRQDNATVVAYCDNVTRSGRAKFGEVG